MTYRKSHWALSVSCVGLMALAACATNRGNADVVAVRDSQSLNSTDLPVSANNNRLKLDESALHGSSVSAPSSNMSAAKRSDELPAIERELVRKWIRYFTLKDRERFQRYLMRGAVYKNSIESVLKDNGLPEELYYLALIESGFSVHAKSHAKAVGIWQFIRATGVRYGLQVDPFVDERRDPIRSTEAASSYLKDLYNLFGSWHLAAAAYNAGEGRIIRAIMKHNTRDFWQLVERGALPSETANYVPKLLAAIHIGRNLERYAFHRPEPHEIPDLQLVKIPSPVNLIHVARESGVDLDTLKQFNPHIRQNVTPLSKRSYGLWIPRGDAVRVQQARLERMQPVLARQVADRAYASEPTPSSSKKVLIHQVRRGETLSVIARKYRVSLNELKQWNQVSQEAKIHAGRRLVIKVARL